MDEWSITCQRLDASPAVNLRFFDPAYQNGPRSEKYIMHINEDLPKIFQPMSKGLLSKALEKSKPRIYLLLSHMNIKRMKNTFFKMVLWV